jgi:uncharacterized protein YkwD
MVLQFSCSKESMPAPFEPMDTLLRTELTSLVNMARQQSRSCGSAGNFSTAQAMTWDERLERAAHRHATDMQRNNFFNHKGSDGTRVGARATSAGYRWAEVGENLALGHDTPSEVILDWLDSPGHCKTIMSSAYTQMGAAKVGSLWVLVVASPL